MKIWQKNSRSSHEISWEKVGNILKQRRRAWYLSGLSSLQETFSMRKKLQISFSTLSVSFICFSSSRKSLTNSNLQRLWRRTRIPTANLENGFHWIECQMCSTLRILLTSKTRQLLQCCILIVCEVISIKSIKSLSNGSLSRTVAWSIRGQRSKLLLHLVEGIYPAGSAARGLSKHCMVGSVFF